MLRAPARRCDNERQKSRVQGAGVSYYDAAELRTTSRRGSEDSGAIRRSCDQAIVTDGAMGRKGCAKCIWKRDEAPRDGETGESRCAFLDRSIIHIWAFGMGKGERMVVTAYQAWSDGSIFLRSRKSYCVPSSVGALRATFPSHTVKTAFVWLSEAV